LQIELQKYQKLITIQIEESEYDKTPNVFDSDIIIFTSEKHWGLTKFVFFILKSLG
jgi:hypothetical protein